MLAPTYPEVATIPKRMVTLYLRAVLDGIKGKPVIQRQRQTTPGSYVVLAELSSGDYVVWVVGFYGAVEGHYFTALDDAEGDFARR